MLRWRSGMEEWEEEEDNGRRWTRLRRLEIVDFQVVAQRQGCDEANECGGDEIRQPPTTVQSPSLLSPPSAQFIGNPLRSFLPSISITLARLASSSSRPPRLPNMFSTPLRRPAASPRLPPSPRNAPTAGAFAIAVAMSVSNLVAEVEHGLEESQNQRDARVEQLWANLEPDRTGELDMKGLQKGLRRIDHPMKNADEMLKRIMKEVDKDQDGKIQYEEFRRFVDKAERQLFALFRSIDKDGNGQLDKNELQTAFKHAGLTVSSRRLNDFFNDMDGDNDGYVSFDEWRLEHRDGDSRADIHPFVVLPLTSLPRNFLLFMPPNEHPSQLHAVLSFYYSVVSVNAEGDSIVSEETLEGLGTDDSRSLFNTLFGSLVRVASPFDYQKPVPEPPSIPRAGGANNVDLDPKDAMDAAVAADYSHDALSRQEDQALTEAFSQQQAGAGTPGQSSTGVLTKQKKHILTDFSPDPGYFLAGAIAGGVSRTATAPLDRLKVYLLVNTTISSETAGVALKQGRPIAALKNAVRPFGDALKDVYKSGGLRSFFAGNGLNVIKIMPETAIKFGSYEAAKRALANFEGHGDPRKINSYSKFTAGGVAGMIAQSFVYPLDTLKFRLQCETVKGGLKGGALIRQTALKMYADGGIFAAYRGLTMGLVGMFPYSAIDMGTFELLKSSYKTYYAKKTGIHEDDVELGNVATGIIGATSGAFGASVVYPLNVVRTRLQTQGTAMHSATYTGIWDVTQKTIAREGYRGLYKGLTPNLLKVAPALSITWIVRNRADSTHNTYIAYTYADYEEAGYLKLDDMTLMWETRPELGSEEGV
ncbi:hypothetical protein G7046_g9428 [Stylonectria norvegica]|nr:hypothetical protein G7046_g9428 [Stylonectria norvegica]